MGCVEGKVADLGFGNFVGVGSLGVHGFGGFDL
jgi:hypothetical protein